jgi:hypothetical protein
MAPGHIVLLYTAVAAGCIITSCPQYTWFLADTLTHLNFPVMTIELYKGLWVAGGALATNGQAADNTLPLCLLPCKVG